MVDGYIYANNYLSNEIWKFSAANGSVVRIWNIPELLQIQKDYLIKNKLTNNYDFGNNVLNGIAFHAPSQNFYLTGKRWDFIFEVKLYDD